MFTKQDLADYQSSGIPRFFPGYRVRAWHPLNDNAADRFFNACVRKQGEVILWDLVDAIDTVLGMTFEDGELVARSKYEPDMIRKQCLQFVEGGRMGNYDPIVLRQAYAKVERMFKLDGLHPLPLESVPYEPSSSAGLPLLCSKADAYPDAIRAARKLQSNQKLAPQPVVMFHRGKNKEEARFVNAYPFEMTLLEGRFFYPFQSAVIQHHTPYAGGRFDFETAAMINEIRIKSRFVGLFDYSKYDSSISSKLIMMAFNIVKKSFIMDDQDMMDWDRITRFFITGPMLAPDGYIYYGRKHGVPSGSTFTQLIDSLVNAICLEYVTRMMHVKPTRYLVMGDDVVIGLDRPVTIARAASFFAELGIKLNTEKSSVITSSQNVHFLGHDWLTTGRSRDIGETLRRLVTPERPSDRYFNAKTRADRRAYLIERIQQYQEDNPRAWRELERLAQFYQLPEIERKVWVAESKTKGKWVTPLWHHYFNYFYGGSMTGIPGFSPKYQFSEQGRWRLEKRQIKVGDHRGKSAWL